jgi:tRNA (guanine37-N1)-methyltransferase
MPVVKPLDVASILDRDAMKKTLSLVALRIPSQRCSAFLKTLSKSLLNYPRTKNIMADTDAPDKRTKLILLSDQIKEVSSLPVEMTKFIEDEGAKVVPYSLTLDYDYFTVEQVLKQIMPEGVEVPSSFETIGHVAHMNLREPHMPYRKIIGQVIIDKNRKIRTVVNKMGSIANQFRTFQMEVLAGEDDLMVEVKESKATFRFNFSEVYWNSKLQQEHLRLLKTFDKTEVICDMFCGIGPFAVPAGMRGCAVHANDLNPRSHFYLDENVRLNSVTKKVTTYNLCAREFLAQMVETGIFFDHTVMNLPADAIEFMDVFRARFDSWKPGGEFGGEKGWKLPTINCYCFSKAEDTKEDVLQRSEKVLQCTIDRSLATTKVHDVRDVAPNKRMMCVTFQLPAEAAFSSPENQPIAIARTGHLTKAATVGGLVPDHWEGEGPGKSKKHAHGADSDQRAAKVAKHK